MNWEPILDFVNHFDAKGVSVVFLGSPTGSGTTLLQSLLDNHSQMLNVPVTVSYLCNEPAEFEGLSTEERLEQFLTACQIRPAADRTVLADKKGFDLQIEAVQEHMKALSPLLQHVTPDRLLLLFYACYGQVHGKDLAKIKMVLIHDRSFCEWEPLGPDQADEPPSLLSYAEKGDKRLEAHLAAFAQAKLLFIVREPMAALYHAIQCFLMDPGGHPHDLKGFYHTSYQGILRYYWTYAMVCRLGDRVQWVQFENLHQHLSRTMQHLARVFDIHLRGVLLEPTFDGIPWTSLESIALKTGLEEQIREPLWKTAWDRQTIAVFYTLTQPLYGYFQYDKPLLRHEDTEAEGQCKHQLNHWVTMESDIYDKYPVFLGQHYLTALEQVRGDWLPPLTGAEGVAKLMRENNRQMQFWARYPLERMKLINYLQRGVADLIASAQQGATVSG